MPTVLIAAAVLLSLVFGAFSVFRHLAGRGSAMIGWVLFAFAFSAASVPLLTISALGFEGELNLNPNALALAGNLAELAGAGLSAWAVGLVGLFYWKDRGLAFSLVLSCMFGLMALSESRGDGLLPLSPDMAMGVMGAIGFGFFATYVAFMEPKVKVDSRSKHLSKKDSS